jgi:hypothetical protein
MFKHGGVFCKMKIKRMVKRLLAVGTGVTMLGATAMGALAADLSNYPDMFVSDGTFDGFLVVGENAKPVDNLAMTDIAAAMKYRGSSGKSTVSVEGDAWKVATGAEWLEVNESIGPSGAAGVVDYIGGTELAALADGLLSNSKGNFDYTQKLVFDNAVGSQGRAWFQENDDDEVGLFWKITDGEQIGLYELDFSTDAESDIDASDSNSLKDFEDKTLTIMGQTYTLTTATFSNAATGQVKLVFMAGAASGTLLEGDTGTYSIGDNSYDVTVTYVDETNVAFTVNGESTGKLEDGETFTMSDGNEIGVSDILYQNYAGGVHQGSFFIGANKLEIKDEINDTAYSSTEVKVNEETIDGATPYIKGTIVTDPVGTTTDGELKIDFIRINMTAQDDIYLGPGDKLSKDSELAEPQLLFTENWDFEYHGTDPSSVKDHTFRLQKAGDDKYELKFTAQDGNDVTLPLMFVSADNEVQLGKKSGDNLALNVGYNITDDDYFFLANKDTDVAGNSDAVVTLLQYQSSKNNGDDSQTIKFKNLNNGETIIKTFDDDCVFDISLEGRTHNFINATDSPCASDNWEIRLTSTDYAHDTPLVGNVSHINLRDASGAKLDIYNTESGVSANQTDGVHVTNGVGLIFDLVYDDTDLLDDHTSTSETVWSYNLSETGSSEVTAAVLTDSAWSVSDPDDTDVTWKYSNTGVLTKHVAASGVPVELEVTVPSKSREVLAYVTSGATESVSSATGDLTSVEFVDATKLDSEVASATAQNLVVVGGPCVNSVAAELLGNPANCAEGFTPGKARVKLIANGDNMAMLVAGYSGADTRLAGKVVANRWTELSGDEVEIEGTTYSDATIGAPTVMADVEEDAVVADTDTE